MFYAGYQTTKWLRFEYDWNLTVFTMESKDQISGWFDRFGIDVRFDKKHSQNRRAQKDKTCKIEDISDGQRVYIQQRLADDFKIYEAARRNNGSIRIRHHLQVVSD